MTSCLVQVKQGTLQGKLSQTYNGRAYYSFEGIPYAKPPVGKLRFRDPQPPDSWDGIRDATKPGNRCAQMNPLNPIKVEGSEDCLYLNIYTPSLPQDKLERLPVIFYVHGGRYILGYGDYYRPDYFLQNDVILVTINYRLHILGFLSLHTKEVPGNAGLKDSVAALRWIKDNIKHFNGDDDNITIAGESSGAGTVTAFLASKMTDGLFHKIIAESGSCLSDLIMIDEDVIARAKFITSHLGHDLKDVNDIHELLLNASIEDLCIAVTAAESAKPTIDAFFLPVVEKAFDDVEAFFEEYPLKVFKEGRFKNVPVLTGYASHEGALFIQRSPEGNITFQTDLEIFIPRYLFIPKGSKREEKFVVNLHKYYFGDKSICKDTKLEYLNFVSDTYFLRDIHTLIEMMAKFSNQIYVYRFEYTGEMSTRVMKNLGVKGACHGDILQYQFYRKSKADSGTKDDQRIVRFLSDAWYSFVKTGKPTCNNEEVIWPPYSKEQRNTLNISNEITLLDNPAGDRMDFWKKLMGERSKL